MRKTLLTALKHGSGTIFILLAMMLGGSLQAWGDVTVTEGEIIVVDVNYCSWFGNNSCYPVLFIGENEVTDKTATIFSTGGVYELTITSTATGTLTVKRYNGEFYNSISTTSRSSSANRLKVNDDCSTLSWSYVRYFSAGEYIYFVNGTGYPYYNSSDKHGTVDDNWVKSSHYAGIKLTMSDGATQYAWFSYYGGSPDGSTGAIYRAQISTAGYCKSFVVTRNETNNSGGDPTGTYWNKTGDLGFNATNIAYNTITKTAESGTDWTGNYTSYCNAPTPSTGSASSITATTVTLGATVAAAASNPCTPTYVGVNVYSDSSCETLVTSGQTAFVNYATTYSIGITSLSPKTTYYFKAYAISDAGTTEASSHSSFTTSCLSGVATTNPSTSTQTACLGSATALSVTASGGPGSGYTYQWYYNSTASTTGAIAIPGATSSSYTPAVVGENYYYCSVGAAGGYCDVDSNFSGKITIKGVPVVSASASSVTNYVPVTLTATGVESTNWSITSGAGGYLYDTNATTVKFKGNVGSSGPVTYTIQATSDGCSGTANVTVSRNSDNCQ